MDTIFCIIFVLAICCVPYFGFAQPKISFPKVAEMSPNAASIAQYQDTPVSYYSGIPDISIPLYEIDVDGFKLPITLSYHASGIRVAQEASWVGLGWMLNVGGAISRTVKNMDDFLNYPVVPQGKAVLTGVDPAHPYACKGYFYAPKIETTDVCTVDPNYKIYTPNLYRLRTTYAPTNLGIGFTLGQVYDSEPDIFYYSLPSFSGKFIFNKQQKAVLFNEQQNLLFEPYYDAYLHQECFKVVDCNGNHYIFKDMEMTQNYHQKQALNRNYTDRFSRYDNSTSSFVEWVEDGLTDSDLTERILIPANPYKYSSCWYLSEIITNKNRHIKFTYEREDQYLPTQESYEVAISGTNGVKMDAYYQSKTVNEALRLKRIDYDFGYVTFECSNRLDIKTSKRYPSKKLDRIFIYGNDKKLIKDITFDYEYFNSEKIGTDFDYIFLRLKLKSILDSKIDRPYSFSYNESNSMPAKNSKNCDYWGFFNGRNYGAKYNIAALINGKYYEGVNKAANPKYVATYVLDKIKYPTGGYETFEYESPTIPPHFCHEVPADPGISGYPIKTDFSEHFLTYNNAGINEFENVPSDTIVSFTLKSKTQVYISCILESANGERDPDFWYSNFWGTLTRKGTFTSNYYFSTEFPDLYGIQSQYLKKERRFDLPAGDYEFHTGKLPKEVYAEWVISDDAAGTKIIFTSDDNTNHYTLNSNQAVSFEYAGGLRIKAIQSDMKRRKFSYECSKLLVEPILSYISQRYIGSKLHSVKVMPSESTTPMSTFKNGNLIGYDRVTETIENDDSPSCIRYFYKNDGEYELIDDNFPEGPVNINYTDGLLERKNVYWDDVLIKQNVYEYKSTYSSPVEAIYDRSCVYSTHEYMDYRYIVEWPKLSKEIETIYDAKDENKKIIVTKTYTYNNRALISQEATSDGITTYKNVIYYPFDFASQENIYKQMTDSNAICTPVEIVRTKNDAVIGATRASYQKINNMFLIKTHEELDLKCPTNFNEYKKYYSVKENFDKYDIYGNLCQYRNSEGKVVTYLWGYNYQYPIAEIENVTYPNVITRLGGESTVQSFLAKGNPTVAEVFTFLQPIKDKTIPNSYMKFFTYIPLIGMATKTDINGKITYYNYDTKGRLSSVMNNDKNTIQKFNYNIK